MLPKKKWKETSTSLKGSINEDGADSSLHQRLYAVALKALTRRNYITCELEKKLLKFSGDPSLIPAVIERLKASGFLNDRRTIEFLVQSQRNQKSRGRSRIECELRKKGLSSGLIREVMDEVYPAKDENEPLIRALEKKLKTLSPPIDAKKIARLYNHLFARGFQPETIHQELRKRFHSEFD